MDAVKFLEEVHRMCLTIDCLDGCPLYERTTELCTLETPDSMRWKEAKQLVSAVEKWSAEHPQKTRLMDFLEKYPKAPLKSDGYPQVLPVVFGYCNRNSCLTCHYINKACWDLPIEEES